MLVRQIQDVIAENLALVIATRKAEGRPMPWITERELRLFLTCGEPVVGHAVLACITCAVEYTVAFTCKRRSVCPRCIARRREERTHHLLTKVLADVPYRHWVLCLPAELRYNLGRHPALTAGIVSCIIAAIFRHLRAKALRMWPSLAKNLVHAAAVSFRHRVSANLTANIHVHCVVADGVFVELVRGGRVEFLPLDAPTDAEIARIATNVCSRARRLLKRHGVWRDARDPQHPGAIRGVVTLRRARTITLVGRAVATPGEGTGDAFELYARDRVDQGDRAGLENLVRYLLAPPFTGDQLSLDADGRIVLRLKRPRHDGSAEERFTPHEFVEALLALIPHPRSHAIGYHGALARNARVRKLVIPQRRTRPSGAILGDTNDMETPAHREAWKQLHVRAHREDFLTCPVCCDKLVLVSLVGQNLKYRNPRWMAPDTPSHPAAAPVSEPQQGLIA